MKVALRFAVLMPAVIGLASCGNLLGGGGGSDSVPPHARQLPASTQALLAIKGMTQEAPIFVRIFKEESELEVWKLKNGKFELFRSYAICAWSGTVGPKVQQGDKQAPEGFYTVSANQMNPHSLYHLAFNVGFPNAYDRANGHTGSALMVHGNCKSAGCYAMTDAYIEEIYILARDAMTAGQTRFHVHAYPFRMTDRNMRAHRDSPWYPFWSKLKEGYDSFEASGRPPVVKVCSKQYLVNVQFTGQAADPSPDAPCPMYSKIDPSQAPNIDGVPATMFAGLKKPEISMPPQAAPAAPAPGIALASAQNAAPPSRQQTAAFTNSDTSASPVVTRSLEPHPQPQPAATASMIAAKPQRAASSSRAFASAAATASEPQAPAPLPIVTSPATTNSPLSHQALAPRPQPQAAPVSIPVQSPPQTVAAAEAPSKYVDPDALQKPNRSGKGGKLAASAPSAPAEDPSSSVGLQPQSPSAQPSYGFNGQTR